MADVFISYKSEDRAHVAPIAAALEQSGFSVWWDPQIEVGARYADHIANELEIAKAIIVVWSHRSVGSDWVRHEADAARETDRLIPVRIDTAKLPPPYNQFQCADLSAWDGALNSTWERVIGRVSQLIDNDDARVRVALARATHSAPIQKVQRWSLPRQLAQLAVAATFILGVMYVLAEVVPYRGNGRIGVLDLTCDYRLTAAPGLSTISTGDATVNLRIEFEPKGGSDARWALVRSGRELEWNDVDGGSGDNLCLDVINGTTCRLSLDLRSGTFLTRHDGSGGDGNITDSGRCRRRETMN